MSNNKEKHAVVRTGKILNNKFRKYFFPATISAIAVSLNEFVDSLLVAQLLGASAMSIINIASPIIFIACGVYALFGNGGSALYSYFLGERKNDDAAQTFTLAVFMPIIVAAFISVFCFLFFNQTARFLVSDATSLLESLKLYLIPTLLALPLISGVCAFLVFLPAFGKPVYASIVAITSNVINLGMDYVFIKGFGLGVEGAGYATLTGYIVAVLMILYFFISKKVDVELGTLNFKNMPSILKRGAPSAVGQLGLAIKIGVCNTLAIKYGGEIGVALMSVCSQINSIVSIAITGIVDASSPIISLLHGQRDHAGKKYVVNTMLKYNAITVLIEAVLLASFPVFFLNLYKIPAEYHGMGKYAVILYAIMCVIRSFIICYEYILDLTGHELYSTLISLYDGIFGIVLYTNIFTLIIGLNGLWLGYLVNSVTLAVIILMINSYLLKKNEKYDNILLLEKAQEGSLQMDVSLEASNKSISKLSEKITEFCEENNINEKTAKKVGLVAEEMAVYTRNHHKGHFDIDVLLHITNDNIYLDFRSDTTPFNPLSKDDNDKEENYIILKSLSKEIEYSYLLGMNSTRIIMDR